MAEEEQLPQASILVVDDDEAILVLVEAALRASGYSVTTATDGAAALALIRDATPDLVISDVSMPDVDGFEFVRQLRALPEGRAIPFIFLTALGSSDDVVTGMRLGADDYLRKPFDVRELVARTRGKLERRPVPQELLPLDLRSGFLSRRAFGAELEREGVRAERAARDGSVASVAVVELPRLRERLGARAADELDKQLVAAIAAGGDALESVGIGGRDEFLLLLPEQPPAAAEARLRRVAARIASTRFTAGAEHVRLTPAIGHAAIGADADAAIAHARLAAAHSGLHLDLEPRAWEPVMDVVSEPRSHAGFRAFAERLRLPLQLLATLIPLVVPFWIYVWLDSVGIDVASVMYLVVVAALLMTATLIWVEGLAAMGAAEPPEEPGAPYPSAAAIIAAYLPNESATILETLEAFLALDYPAPLQVILAYNTPQDMPIEAELRALAEHDPRLVPFRVHDGTSKAQNVNAALAIARGEFVGVFDADHQPAPDAFRRAWRWLSNGYDVVQGHCLVRNGDASWVARTVAVEFEMIYAVSHPGRARLHGFGIFGGSNGFWRTQLLAETRMRGWMLTEDIDSSMRVIQAGGRIASDRRLVSRELAPTTLKALWNQRMRWAQGWFQVTKRHAWLGLRAPGLSLRNKLGLTYLLVWRELYPWISLQIAPLIAFYAYKAGGAGKLEWFVPIFVLTTLFTISTGPWQTLFAWKLGAPEIKQKRRWFWLYLIVSSLFYTEFKNTISRVAQVKELMRERAWKVTPRAAEGAE